MLAGAGLSATALAKPTTVIAPAAPDDEPAWRAIQAEFDVDRSMVNLNNGGVSPSPRLVHEAMKTALDTTNLAPAHYLWGVLEPGVEAVRGDLALEANVSPDEIAITRNASESLQIVQLGLPLTAGDEVVVSNLDYPRMRTTWAQRAARDGVVVREVVLPTPLPDDATIVALFRAQITERTRLVHVTQVLHWTGGVLPVAALCALAREAGAFSLVDGAHAFGLLPSDLRAYGCDAYGTSLHKWLNAPIGAGMLFVRRERIEQIWPLQPADPSLVGNIRKFEEIGTHPAAMHDAIGAALVFHRMVGRERKLSRVQALRRRWVDGIAGVGGARVLTTDDPARSAALGTVSFPGVEPGALAARLWSERRIFVTPIVHPDFVCIRVTPGIQTSREEVDRFVTAIRELVPS
jgi:selenocysteine lyase/cysteine desulfurase